MEQHCASMSIRRELLRIAMAQRKKKLLDPTKQDGAAEAAAVEMVTMFAGAEMRHFLDACEATRACRRKERARYHHQDQHPSHLPRDPSLPEDVAGPVLPRSAGIEMEESIFDIHHLHRSPYRRHSPRAIRVACPACTFVARTPRKSYPLAMVKKHPHFGSCGYGHIDSLEPLSEPEAEDLAGPSFTSTQTSSSSAISLPLRSPCSTCTSVSLLHPHRHRKLPASSQSSPRNLNALPMASITEYKDDPSDRTSANRSRHIRQRNCTSLKPQDGPVITEILPGCPPFASSQQDVITEILPSPSERKNSKKPGAKRQDYLMQKKQVHHQPTRRTDANVKALQASKGETDDQNDGQSAEEIEDCDKMHKGHVEDSLHKGRALHSDKKHDCFMKKIEEACARSIVVSGIRTSNPSISTNHHRRRQEQARQPNVLTALHSDVDDCSLTSTMLANGEGIGSDHYHMDGKSLHKDNTNRKHLRLSVEVFPAKSLPTGFGVKIVQQLPPNDLNLSPRFSVDLPPPPSAHS